MSSRRESPSLAPGLTPEVFQVELSRCAAARLSLSVVGTCGRVAALAGRGAGAHPTRREPAATWHWIAGLGPQPHRLRTKWEASVGQHGGFGLAPGSFERRLPSQLAAQLAAWDHEVVHAVSTTPPKVRPLLASMPQHLLQEQLSRQT